MCVIIILLAFFRYQSRNQKVQKDTIPQAFDDALDNVSLRQRIRISSGRTLSISSNSSLWYGLLYSFNKGYFVLTSFFWELSYYHATASTTHSTKAIIVSFESIVIKFPSAYFRFLNRKYVWSKSTDSFVSRANPVAFASPINT